VTYSTPAPFNETALVEAMAAKLVDKVPRFMKRAADPLSMDNFLGGAMTALEPLSLITRDTIAQLVMLTDGLFGNLNDITQVLNVIMNMANVVLSTFPFGALVPLLIQGLINIVLSSQTKFFVQYTMFRIWQLLPQTQFDRFQVLVQDNQVLVVSSVAQPTLPPLPTLGPVPPTLMPLPTLPPVQPLPTLPPVQPLPTLPPLV
jgi:hypothetical protein